MLLFSVKDLMISTLHKLFFEKLQSFRFYKTKLIERNKNFEPNLQSFSLLNQQLQVVCLQIL